MTGAVQHDPQLVVPPQLAVGHRRPRACGRPRRPRRSAAHGTGRPGARRPRRRPPRRPAAGPAARPARAGRRRPPPRPRAAPRRATARRGPRRRRRRRRSRRAPGPAPAGRGRRRRPGPSTTASASAACAAATSAASGSPVRVGEPGEQVGGVAGVGDGEVGAHPDGGEDGVVDAPVAGTGSYRAAEPVADGRRQWPGRRPCSRACRASHHAGVRAGSEHRGPGLRSRGEQGQRGGPGVVVDQVEVADGDQPAGGSGSSSNQRSSSSRSWSGPPASSSTTHREPVEHADGGEHLPRRARAAHSGSSTAERGVVGQQRAQRGVGQHQLVGAGRARRRRRAGRAPTASRATPRPGAQLGDQREHGLGQRRRVQPGLGVVHRPVDGVAQRRVVEQRGGLGERGAEPGEQRVHGVGVGDVQAGQREVAHRAAGVGAQRAAARSPGRRTVRPSASGTGSARSSSRSPGTVSAAGSSAAYTARHQPAGRRTPSSRSTSSAGPMRWTPSSASTAATPPGLS